jgi:hypothetical protein
MPTAMTYKTDRLLVATPKSSVIPAAKVPEVEDCAGKLLALVPSFQSPEEDGNLTNNNIMSDYRTQANTGMNLPNGKDQRISRKFLRMYSARRAAFAA